MTTFEECWDIVTARARVIVGASDDDPRPAAQLDMPWEEAMRRQMSGVIEPEAMDEILIAAPALALLIMQLILRMEGPEAHNALASISVQMITSGVLLGKGMAS